jgi:hypothetical protein
MLEFIGTKWNPRIDTILDGEGVTYLCFDSAWVSPDSLFMALHELTDWKIINRHGEPD